MERSADWIEQARRDLEHAASDLERLFFEWACFSAQQAAEKATKAVLMKLGVESWGHSVADLLEELGRLRPVPPALVEAGLELDKAYIASRYPNAHPSGAPGTRYTRTEAQRMVDHAANIVQFCEVLLSTI